MNELATVVWTEQGLGDEILQASLVPDLCQLADTVTLLCSKRLVTLFDHSFDKLQVLAKDDAARLANVAAADFALPLLDTAAVFRRSQSSFPGTNGYLTAPDALVEEIRSRYFEIIGDTKARPFLIGLSWQSKHALYGPQNTLALENWRPIFSIAKEIRRPVIFVAAQYGVDSNEIERLNEDFGITLFADPVIDYGGDFEDIAAQISALDLVISTSTTTAQLAAALGIPVWHLTSAGLARGWYWMAENETSPWHPTMRQFRRSRMESHERQVNAVAEALRTLLKE